MATTTTPDSTSSDYRAVSPERRAQKREAARRFRERHGARVRAEAAERLEKNREAINRRRRERYAQNPDPVLARNATWAAANPEKRKRSAVAVARINALRRGQREANTARVRAWRDKNRESVRSYTRAYEARRIATDLDFRLRKAVRNRVRAALKGVTKRHQKFDLIGCSVERLRAHLESLFAPGMSWDNWSATGWHIDHIRPLAAFDLTDDGQLRRACHWTNLQPLWAKDNLSKGASI